MERSFIYGTIGLSIALTVLVLKWWLDGKTLIGHRTQPTNAIALPIAYFAAMEFIQVAQHGVAAPSYSSPQCDTFANKALTMVGAMHIAFQPLALHFGFGGHYTRDLSPSYTMLVRLVAVGCLMDATMMLTAWSNDGQGLRGDYDWDSCGAYQWTVGNKLCTYRGDVHLAWSIPFPTPTYYYPGSLHSFVFFAPFLVAGSLPHAFRGFLLFLTGPMLAEYLTGWRRHESPSVWCYAFLANNLSVYFFGLIFDLYDLYTGGWSEEHHAVEDGHASGNGVGMKGRTNGHVKKGNGYSNEYLEAKSRPLVLDWYDSLTGGKRKTM